MKRIDDLITLVKPYYPGSDPAHDWAHICRVVATAKRLADGENVNLECLLAAVYCHDLVNLPKDHPERKNASGLAAQEAAPLLIQAGFNASEIELITRAIIEHSFSRGLTPSCLESAIVQDADRLDTLGAIGILRCASINTQMQARFYEPFDPLADMRDLDDKSFMLDHYFVKLFKLPEIMNTSRAKAMAMERAGMMKDFVQVLMKEIR